MQGFISRNYYIQFLFIALMLSFSLPMSMQTWIVGLWIVSMMVIGWQEKITITRKEVLAILFFTISFFSYVAMYLRTPVANFSYIHFILERKASLLLFPLPALITIRLYKDTFLKQLIWFPLGITAKFIITHILFLFHEQGMLIFQTHVAYRDTFNEVAQIHPTYFGMYLVFAILILQYGYVKSFLKQDTWRRVWQILLILFLVLLSPKSPMLALGMIAVIDLLLWSRMQQQQKIILVTASMAFFVLAWWQIPLFHDRVQEVVEFFTKNSSSHGGTSMEMRQLIFQTDMALLKDHWVVGLGPFALEEKMNQAFYLFSIMHQQSFGFYNTHNEFLNQWLCFGIAGILYFLFLLVVHGLRAVKCKNYLYISSLLLLVMCFTTENILSRQHGVIFFALFMAIFYFQHEVSSEKRPSSTSSV